MKTRFLMQILLGDRTYGVDEIADVDDRKAVDLIRRGVAVEHVQPAPAPVVREAVAVDPKQARKAVSR